MDGDEERRTGGVALLGDAPHAEDADADVAPDSGSDDASAAVAAPDGADAPEVTKAEESPADESPADAVDEVAVDKVAVDEPTTDESPADEDAAPPTDEAAVDGSPEETDGSGAAEAADVPGTRRPVRRKWSPRRGAAVAAVVLVVALAVSAFATVGSSATTGDSHFLDTARSQGHVIAPGRQEGLLVSAAHKICDRRESHSTTAQRRATALSTDELDVVNQSFGGDSRSFTVLALDTYCSS